jgi:hypothetical protein
MSAEALGTLRFIRKTQLAANEYRRNFRQMDCDVIAAVTSAEADRVTPLMGKVYLRLVNAPDQYWERDGVLRVEAEAKEGKVVKAWAVLCGLLGVASATASKALQWMHTEGIIGYFAGKNGVGIRIFLNRAANSIGTRAGKKILEFPPASSRERPASQNEPAFKDNFVVPEVSDTDFNSRAPKNGAADEKKVDKTSPEPRPAPSLIEGSFDTEGRGIEVRATSSADMLHVDEIVRRLRSELEPTLQQAARQAARQEHERTREWLESRGLPKAARVAQREAYNVLRNHGVIRAAAERARADLGVGRNNYAADAKQLTEAEIKELAEMCIAMLETHGQSVDTTLAEISTEAGGCLLPEDAPKVRELAESMLQENNLGGGL